MTLSVRDLSKRFGATQALAGVTLNVDVGEVLALLGENGAGKSTLIKILGGIYSPDEGEVLLDGKAMHFAGPAASLAAGIVVIPQELQVVPALSVAENVLLGQLPVRRHAGILPVVDRAAMRLRAAALLADIGIDLDVDAPVGTLAFAERQLVVIARALGHRARVLVLDEPTAALEAPEVQRLFDVVRRLRDQSVAVIYISHRLAEISELADRCIVLRDGRIAAHIKAPPFLPRVLGEAMSGSVALPVPDGTRAQAGALRLSIQVEDAQLDCRKGEVVGLGGLLGSGAKELLRRVFGAANSGRSHGPGAAKAIASGIGFVPGERSAALVMTMSVRDNIVLPHLDAFRTAFGRDDRKIDTAVAGLMTLLDIRPRNARLPVGTLSGGNQQKVAFAKWLVGRIDVLLLDEPTHGIDIAAKALIHRHMASFVDGGGTCLLSSSDTAELLALSDDIVVLRRGRVAGRMSRGEGFSEGIGKGDGEGFSEQRLRDLLGAGA
jgi:ABC-type sugar transport system ATPase subunit